MVLNPHMHSATAFAPATCANVAIGFDILGFALEDVGDYVRLTRRQDNKIIIESINSLPHETLPLNVQENTASAVLQKLCQELDLDVGFSIHIQKGIPLSSGMGGSAASAVAALTAFNAFLNTPLSREELAHHALFGEQVASGQQHADNVVPCIFGGLTLIHSLNPIKVVQLPVPELCCVLVHPHLYVSTLQARKILKEQLPLKDYVKQSANLAAFISALYEKNFSLMQAALNDVLIEPQRAQFVPGFYEIKAAAMNAGALGVSFSGSGPSIFALAREKQDAERIKSALSEQLAKQKIAADYWISQISKHPAQITQLEENDGFY